MNTSAEINSTNSDADAHKSPERLEQEVNQTRARIEDRLVSLTQRLSPGEILDQALGMAREHGGEFSHNLGSQVKQNPVPLVLTGIGLAWLMMGSRDSGNGAANGRRYPRGAEYDDASEYGAFAGSSDEYAGEYPAGYRTPGSDASPGMLDKAKDALGGIADKAHDLSGRAHDSAAHAGERAHDASGRARDMKHSAEERISRASMHVRETSAHMRDRMRSSQEQLTDFFREQPILAGGLGIALGAALGALLPPTETEDRLMGRSSADAVNKGKAAAGEKFATAREKVNETVHGAVDTLKEDMHKLKENVHEAAARQSEKAKAETQPTDSKAAADAPENTAQNNPSTF